MVSYPQDDLVKMTPSSVQMSLIRNGASSAGALH